MLCSFVALYFTIVPVKAAKVWLYSKEYSAKLTWRGPEDRGCILEELKMEEEVLNQRARMTGN